MPEIWGIAQSRADLAAGSGPRGEAALVASMDSASVWNPSSMNSWANLREDEMMNPAPELSVDCRPSVARGGPHKPREWIHFDK